MIAAVVRGTSKNRTRLSAYVLNDAILHLFNESRRLPRGVTISTPAVVDYATKAANALRKLDPGSNLESTCHASMVDKLLFT